jgi:proline iminopeptidase
MGIHHPDPARIRRLLGRERIILIGHSWGAMLGLLHTQRNPAKVAAFIAVAPLVSLRKSQQAEYDFIVAETTQRGDDATLAQLREIGPPPYETAERELAVDALADRYGAAFHHRKPNRWWVLVSGVLRGLVTP